MMRSCDFCGTAYLAKRSTSRFCGDRCRRRNKGAPPPPKPTREQSLTATGLVDAVRAELDGVGKLDSMLGQQALMLAQALGDPDESASGAAALSRELGAVMAVALRGVRGAADQVDELRRRRDRKRGNEPQQL
jgi:hypothetical protein